MSPIKDQDHIHVQVYVAGVRRAIILNTIFGYLVSISYLTTKSNCPMSNAQCPIARPIMRILAQTQIGNLYMNPVLREMKNERNKDCREAKLYSARSCQIYF